MLDYKFQDEAVAQAHNHSIGQIILPTGTGKSTIESRIIEEKIEQANGFGIYVIATPRILLTNQLMKTVIEHLAKKGKMVRRAVVHSGGDPDFKYEDYSDYEIVRLIEGAGAVTTKNSQSLGDEIIKAHQANCPIIICSTYHSLDIVTIAAGKVEKRINTTLCDEAHNVVSKDFFNAVTEIKKVTDNIFFFTATQRVTASDEGRGMNNTTFYGQKICERTPLEMIEQGYIVRPRLHLVQIDEDESAQAVAIADSFNEHCKLVKGHAKLLVNCNDSDQLIAIVESAEFKQFAAQQQILDPNFKVFYISSVTGYNGDKSKNKEQFVRDLNEHNGPAVILHIKMLTEGIDVPDMSGIMVMGSMGKSRFLQTLGRATRLALADRTAFETDLYFPDEWENMVKPFSYVIVPVFSDSGDDLKEEICDLVEELRSAGFDPSEDIIVSVEKGVAQPEEIDPACEPDAKKLKSMYNLIVEIKHVIESEEDASLRRSTEEKLKKFIEEDRIEDLFKMLTTA
jgi:superfamily II DNA or RNA helicase